MYRLKRESNLMTSVTSSLTYTDNKLTDSKAVMNYCINTRNIVQLMI